MDSSLAQFNHPAWVTAIGTLVAYSLVLLVLFAVVFVLPLAIFLAL